jgi:hypothetical protein
MHTIILKGGFPTLKAVGTAVIDAVTRTITLPTQTRQHSEESVAVATFKGSEICRQNANHMEVRSHETFEFGGATAPS